MKRQPASQASVPRLKALQGLSTDGRNTAITHTHTPVSETVLNRTATISLFTELYGKEIELPLKKKYMFFWTFNLASPTFSTLSLLKCFKENMQITTVSQPVVKGWFSPSYKAEGPAFDPH